MSPAPPRKRTLLTEVPSTSDVIAKLIDELNTSPVSRLRLRAELERRLKKTGVANLRAAELAEISVNSTLDRVEKSFEAWDREGVPRPFNYSKNGAIIIGLDDARYAGDLPAHFFNVLTLVHGSTDYSLLGISALLCATMACDRIFVCDKGGGDAGVDLLARRPGEFAVGHTIFAIQAKAQANPIDRLAVEHIYHRFQLGRQESRWQEYKQAVAVQDLHQAPGLVFALFASKGLSRSGVEAALMRGVMSSSPRQIAYALSKRWSQAQIVDFCKSIPQTRNLGRNLAYELPLSKAD